MAFSGDLRRLARMRLQRRDVQQAVSVPSVMQYLLHRWRAEVSCALVLGDTAVFLDAVREAPPAGAREPGRSELYLYELRDTRVLS